jgi:mycothiol synthase
MTDIVMRRPHLRDLPEIPRLSAGYTLRQAVSPRDDAGLAEALTAAFGERWDIPRVQTRLTATPDVRAVYVVICGDTVVATASNRWMPEQYPDAGVVHWIGTRPDYARQGLASALLVHLLRVFDSERRAAAVLETQDFRLPAIRAYLKFGFLPVYEVNGEDHRAVWSAIFQQLFDA